MSNLNTLPGRVAWALNQRGILPLHAAIQLKWSPSYLPKLLNGKIKDPSAQKLIELADFLGVDFKWLITGEAANEIVITKNGQKRAVIDYPDTPLFAHYAPLISWEEAGTKINSAHDVRDKSKYPTRQIPINAGLGAFCLLVDGNAMVSYSDKYHSFVKGSVVFFDPDVRAAIGNYVLARNPKEKTAIFRRLALDNGRVYLEANNRRHSSIAYTKDYFIVGVLVYSGTAPIEARNPAKLVKKIKYLDELL